MSHQTQSSEFPLKGFFIFLLAFVIMLALAIPELSALEPPRLNEIEQYRRDGSLPARLEFARELGNHKVSPAAVERAKSRLGAMRRGLSGAPQSEIDGAMTPPPAWRGMPTTGTVKILVLLIAFSDYAPMTSNATVQSAMFGSGNPAQAPYESLTNFYARSSYSQLNIQGNVLGWYTTAYPRSNVPETTAGREGLIKEALDYYDTTVGHDFSQYDNDGDGKIDYFVVIWTGPNTGWSGFWWGYQTSWSWWSNPVSYDGKSLDTYSWQWELYNYPSGTYSPGVVIHETGHALGLPDYYDYDDTIGPRGGVGGLDQMDANWGDHNCFSKFLLDWLTPTAYGTGRRTVTLNPSGNTQNCALVMPNTNGSLFGEYFIVQNRYRNVGNDPADYPADGLLIWHVDSTLNAGGTDFVYDNSYTSHKLLRLMEADGLEEIEQNQWANAGDYYVQGKTFDPNSSPNSNNYAGNTTNVSVSSIVAAGQAMSAVIEIIGTAKPVSLPWIMLLLN